MLEYYLMAAGGVVLMMGIVLFLRRIFIRRDMKPETSGPEVTDGEWRMMFERMDALEKYVRALRADMEGQLQEARDYIESHEARVEEALAGLLELLEERLPQEEPFRPLAPSPKRKPLVSMGTEHFLNDASRPQPHRPAAEKNSVRQLSRKGYTTERIAQELGISTGEVKLIIELDAEARQIRD